MSQDTVSVNGIDFPADDLEAALDELTDERSNMRVEDDVAVAGEVIVKGDDYNDPDVTAALVSDVEKELENDLDAERLTFNGADYLYDQIDEARGTPFVSYLEDVDYLIDINDIEERDDGAQVIASYDMTSGEMRGLADDENVRLGRIIADDDLHVNVYDARDE